MRQKDPIPVASVPLARFRVTGEPVPQGSTRSFERNGRTFTRTANAGRLERWRGDIRSAAAQAAPDFTVLDKDDVAVSVMFWYRRPDSHYTASGKIKSTAPVRPRGDVDKLARAVLDALTHVFWTDDSQVVSLWVTKGYAPVSGATISIDRRVNYDERGTE